MSNALNIGVAPNKIFHVTLKKNAPNKIFHVTLKKNAPIHACVSTAFIQSNQVYKGDFIEITDLNNVESLNGDYADVFATNTRWAKINNAWTDTNVPILINPVIAKSISDNSIRITNVEVAIANPVLIISKI